MCLKNKLLHFYLALKIASQRNVCLKIVARQTYKESAVRSSSMIGRGSPTSRQSAVSDKCMVLFSCELVILTVAR